MIELVDNKRQVHSLHTGVKSPGFPQGMGAVVSSQSNDIADRNDQLPSLTSLDGFGVSIRLRTGFRMETVRTNRGDHLRRQDKNNGSSERGRQGSQKKKGNPGPSFLDSRVVSQYPRLAANDLEDEVRIVGVGVHVEQYVDCCLRAIRANSLDIQQEALDLCVGVVNLLEILRVTTCIGFVRFQRGCFEGGSEGADGHHGAVRAFGKVNHALNLGVDFR
jgi:hypothetical protein